MEASDYLEPVALRQLLEQMTISECYTLVYVYVCVCVRVCVRACVCYVIVCSSHMHNS